MDSNSAGDYCRRGDRATGSRKAAERKESGELLWIDGMDGFEFEKGGGKAVARRGREL